MNFFVNWSPSQIFVMYRHNTEFKSENSTIHTSFASQEAMYRKSWISISKSARIWDMAVHSD